MEQANRVTVQEAASILGISEGAVRARIHRGTLETEREGGTVYVRIDAGSTMNERTEQSELVEALREYNTSLQRQLDAEREASAELRRIIAGLVQRVPELGPAQERPEASETAEEAGARGGAGAREEPFTSEERPQEAAQRRSWWQRVWGG
jgi:hypothetical protein